tara:strand:- start:3228 stop:4106 length:879 start_codon:yes stop_codon:yes gene_type:complete
MNKVIFSHIALFIANMIYALNYIFAKDVMPAYVDPQAFILIRVFGAAIIFFIIHACCIKEKITHKDLLYIALCALFGIVINMLCFFEGLSITNPINASLIMITTPLIVYAISCLVFIQERTYKKFFGVVLGLIGAALLITDGKFNLKINHMGDLLIFLNAVSYAIYLLLIKSMMHKYHPITVLKSLFFVGFIITLPIGYSEFLDIQFNIMPIAIILKILFVVLCTTCLAYFLNIYAISKLPASTVAFYIYLQPLLATIFSILWGKDFLTTITLLSAFLIFVGVYFVVKRKPI